MIARGSLPVPTAPGAGGAETAAAPAPPLRVLLDVTHTLGHGTRAPVGMTRVEAEVIAALRAVPDMALHCVRYEAGRGYRPLTAAEAALLGGARPEPAAPDAARRLARHLPPRVRAALPGWARAPARLVRRVLRPRPVQESPGDDFGPVDGAVLVCAANPWDYAAPAAFRAWRARGRRLVLVLHDINFAATYADHIIAMKDGHLYREGPPQTVVCNEVLSDLYAIAVQVHEVNGRRFCDYF